MKDKICISIDRETLLQIKENLRQGLFRNKSHFIEYSVKHYLKRGLNE